MVTTFWLIALKIKERSYSIGKKNTKNFTNVMLFWWVVKILLTRQVWVVGRVWPSNGFLQNFQWPISNEFKQKIWTIPRK